MTSNTDDDPVVRALNKRLAQVALSHEEAVRIRKGLAEYTRESIWTDRYSGRDEFHIAMGQEAAESLLRLLVEHETRTALSSLKRVLRLLSHRPSKPKER